MQKMRAHVWSKEGLDDIRLLYRLRTLGHEVLVETEIGASALVSLGPDPSYMSRTKNKRSLNIADGQVAMLTSMVDIHGLIQNMFNIF